MISRVLGPSPNSHDEALLAPNVATEEEQAAETADQDEDAESDEEQVAETVDDDDGKHLVRSVAAEKIPYSEYRQGEQTETKGVAWQAARG